jgi:prepilin-type processing-associated H-X9-DG protein
MSYFACVEPVSVEAIDSKCLKNRLFSKRSTRSFTLFELLVVAAILAITLAVLLPTLERVQQKAEQVQCLSNLRQIGAAIYLYAADYNGLIVPSLTATSDWTYLLHPYIHKGTAGYSESNARSPVILCPSRSMWLTNLETTYAAHRKVMAITSPPFNDPPRKLTSILRPTEIVMVGDAMQLPAFGGGRCYAAYDFQQAHGWTLAGDPALRDQEVTSADVDADGVGENLRYRHRGYANMLFVDGHVSSFHRGDFKERNVMLSY